MLIRTIMCVCICVSLNYGITHTATGQKRNKKNHLCCWTKLYSYDVLVASAVCVNVCLSCASASAHFYQTHRANLYYSYNFILCVEAHLIHMWFRSYVHIWKWDRFRIWMKKKYVLNEFDRCDSDHYGRSHTRTHFAFDRCSVIPPFPVINCNSYGNCIEPRDSGLIGSVTAISSR